jgi:hypothetical protein
MINNIQKITRTILQPVRNLHLKIHVKMVNEKDGRKENFHNLFTMDNGNSILNLDLQSFLTIELKDGQWAKDKSVLLDQKNIHQVKKAFKKVLDGIYNGGIFAMNKSNKIIMYAEEREKFTQRVYNIGTHQRMVVQPAIIADESEGTEYEGVILYLNRTEHYIELPIDAFESLYYTLKEINMFVYSQVLVNYYISTIQNQKVEIKQNVIGGGTTSKKKPSIFLPETEEVKSTISKNETAEEFFNMPKSE